MPAEASDGRGGVYETVLAQAAKPVQATPVKLDIDTQNASASVKALDEAAGHDRRAHGGSRHPLGFDASARDRYREIIAKHANANGIPFALADAVVRVESRYKPHAYNGGAVGLMQIKPRTARGLGYHGSVAGLYDPETNIAYGVKYLAAAYRLAGGDTCGTVMRYQSGHYATRMNRANLAYCSRVRTIVASLN